jgi:hypothetical protein
MVLDDTNRLTPYHVIHGWFLVMPFHYIAFCPLRYIPKKLMSVLLECAVKGDTPSRNRVHWDDIHYNI